MYYNQRNVNANVAVICEIVKGITSLRKNVVTKRKYRKEERTEAQNFNENFPNKDRNKAKEVVKKAAIGL